MVKVRVLSLNLRYSTQTDGINFFPNRAEKILAVIRREDPDIVGFQEGDDLSLPTLEKALPDYLFLSCGRGADCKGERNPVALKRGKFELLSFQTEWLSETPHIPGSRFARLGQSDCPRIFHTLYLRTAEGLPFFFINTHLDHLSSAARAAAFEMICRRLSDVEGAGAIVGDFNAEPESPELIAFSHAASKYGWKNRSEGVGDTFHAFGKCDPEVQIDYIFSNRAATNAHAVPDPHEGGIYYSDHRAVVADIETE